MDGSADPVSVYAAATGLIHNINRNERQLDREFDHGESRVFASADLLDKRKNGRPVLPPAFVGIDDDIANTGVTVFAPALRQESFLARKREYLRNVESLIGLKRGILGEVEAAQRTATEVTSSQGDYSLTIRICSRCGKQLCGARWGCVANWANCTESLGPSNRIRRGQCVLTGVTAFCMTRTKNGPRPCSW